MLKEIYVPYLTKKDEPSATLVRPGYREKYADTKFASDIYKELEEFEGEKDKTYILVVSVSPTEYWGHNKNKDFFTEKELKRKHHTFCTDGTFFKNHVNKNKAKNYGDNEKSWYDDEMKRVLVLIGVDNKKAPDIAQAAEVGDKLAFSMGCLRPTAKVLMADWSYKEIQHIRKGDAVINGQGWVSIVDYHHSHHHEGEWYKVTAKGIKGIEPTTEEHPWLVLPKEKIKSRTDTSKNGSPEWRRADKLRVGDFIATPIYKDEIDCPYDDEFLFLLGTYLAEGSLCGSPRPGVEFTVNVEDVEYIKSNSPSYEFTVRPHQESEHAAVMYIRNSYDLGQTFLSLCGKGAHTKKLSNAVMSWPEENQKIVLGAYVSGDGGGYKGALYTSTCNYVLAEQVRHMMARCGMITSLNINHHKPSTVVHKDTVEYQVWCGKTTSHILKDYTRKEAYEAKIPDTKRFIQDGYVWTRISKIEITDCDDEVHNIAIKSGTYDNDSYVVSNVALHNCKIEYDVCSNCGNKARTRAEYCDCMKKHAGEILENGIKVGVDNPNPTFFDLSKVVKQAGPIEYMIKHVVPKNCQKCGSLWVPSYYMTDEDTPLEKAASLDDSNSSSMFEPRDFEEKAASLAKLSKMYKELTGRPVSDDELSPKLKGLIDKIQNIKVLSSTPDISDEDIKKLSDHPLKSIMSSCSSIGVRLKTPELSKIIASKKQKCCPEVESLEHNLKNAGANLEEVVGQDPFEYLMDRPPVFKMLLKSAVFSQSSEDMSSDVLDVVEKYFKPRTLISSEVEKRAFLDYPGGALDLRDAYDLEGNQYLTTEESIDRAKELNLARDALKGVGLAGLMGAGGLAALKMPLIGSKYMVPAGVFGGLLAGRKLNEKFFQNDPLSPIPPETVLQKVSHIVKDCEPSKLSKEAQMDQELLYGLSQEMGPPMGYQEPSAWDNAQGVWNWIKYNPELAVMAGLVGGGAAAKGYQHLKPALAGLDDKLLNSLDMVKSKATGIRNNIRYR